MEEKAAYESACAPMLSSVSGISDDDVTTVALNRLSSG